MLKKVIVFFLFIFVSNCSPSYKGNDTQEHLGMTIFNAFVNDDIKEYQKYIITAEDYIKLLDSTNYSQKKKDKLIANYNANIPVINQQIYNNFDEVKKEATKLNVDLKNVKFDKVEFRDMHYSSIDYAYVNIVFFYEGKKYFIRLNDCIRTVRGWQIGGVVFLSEYPVD